MIDNIRNFHFYHNGNDFFGSYEGMRFAIEVKKEEEVQYLSACVWPAPFTRDKTSEDKIKYERFDMSPEGLENAKKWLNRQYDEDREKWLLAQNAPLIGKK